MAKDFLSKFCLQPLTPLYQKIRLSQLFKENSLVSFGTRKRTKLKEKAFTKITLKGGIRTTDVVQLLKAMRLAWIPHLPLKHANSNWNSVPNFFLRRLGGVYILRCCNYDVTFLNPKLPTFYQDMPSFFDDLKTLCNYNLGNIVLCNNREILIDGKHPRVVFSKGIILIRDLLNEQSQLLSIPIPPNEL